MRKQFTRNIFNGIWLRKHFFRNKPGQKKTNKLHYKHSWIQQKVNYESVFVFLFFLFTGLSWTLNILNSHNKFEGRGRRGCKRISSQMQIFSFYFNSSKTGHHQLSSPEKKTYIIYSYAEIEHQIYFQQHTHIQYMYSACACVHAQKHHQQQVATVKLW